MPKHAQRIRVDVDTSDVLKTFTKFKKFMPEFMHEGLLESMEYVGLTAVQKYMKVRHVVDAATGRVQKRKSGEKLGILTSRLSRSILGKEGPKGAEYIRKISTTGGQITAEIGSKVPYAAIHEYGGDAGRNRSVKIPARPYLNPAVQDSDQAVYNIMKAKLELTIRASEGGF